MLPGRRGLHALAADLRFEAGALEKVFRLAEILPDVSRHPRLRGAFVLKGGSAFNLFYGTPTRLSVDLDFNFVGSLELEAMVEARPGVEEAVEQIARSQGYQVQRSSEAHAGRKFFLGYRRHDGLPDRIEIDVNFLDRLCLLPAETRRIWRPDGESAASFPVLAFDELIAGKIGALLDRVAPRDAWDVCRIPDVAPEAWPGPKSKAIFVALSGRLPLPLHAYGRSRLERLVEEDVARRLHPMLPTEERPTAAGLSEQAWKVIGPLLELTDPEREYCDRLQEGEILSDLLFPDDDDLAQRLRKHPALLWKVENASAHASGKRGNSKGGRRR